MRAQQHSLILEICSLLQARNLSYLIRAVILKLVPLQVLKHLHHNSYWLMFIHVVLWKNTYLPATLEEQVAPTWDTSMYPTHVTKHEADKLFLTMQGRFRSKLGLGYLSNCVGKQVLNWGTLHRRMQTHELDLSVSLALASSSTLLLFFPCLLNIFHIRILSLAQNSEIGVSSAVVRRAAEGGFFKAM